MIKDRKIVDVILKLAGRKGWADVTVASVAKALRVAPASFKKRFVSPEAFVPLVMAEATRVSLAEVPSDGESAHDALFAILMARFDFLSAHKKAVLSIASAAREDRALLRAWTGACFEGMRQTLWAAGEKGQPLSVVALMGVYGWAFWAWRNDDTSDLSKTMAALDRALRWYGVGS